MKTMKFYTLALALLAMGALATGQAEANDYFAGYPGDINGYNNNVHYDDMFDDKYTTWDKFQHELFNGRSPDTDAGYYNGVKYDDVYDDKYTKIDELQDDVSEVGREIQYDAKSTWDTVTTNNAR